MDKKNPLGNIGKFENQYTKGATSMQYIAALYVVYSRLKFEKCAILCSTYFEIFLNEVSPFILAFQIVERTHAKICC